MKLSEKLFSLRVSSGLTRTQVAEAVGVTYRAIVNYEQGSRVPKKDCLYKLAELYSVDMNDLISKEDLFVLDAGEDNGSRGRAAAKKLIQNANVLFAGGQISEEDKEQLFQALQESYWKSKLKNKKYTPKKYLKNDTKEDDSK